MHPNQDKTVVGPHSASLIAPTTDQTIVEASKFEGLETKILEKFLKENETDSFDIHDQG